MSFFRKEPVQVVTPAPAAPTENTNTGVVLDTPAIRRAQVVAARGEYSPGESERGRLDLEASGGRHTVEFAILKALYGEVDRKQDERVRERQAQAMDVVQQRVLAFKGARLTNWKNLGATARALYLASERPGNTISDTLWLAAELVERDTSNIEPPKCFQPERQ